MPSAGSLRGPDGTDRANAWRDVEFRAFVKGQTLTVRPYMPDAPWTVPASGGNLSVGSATAGVAACQHDREISVASSTSLSPTARLLLLTAAVRPSDTALRQLLSAGIDWDELCTLAQREKAAPIVLRHLERLGLSLLGSEHRNLRQLARFSVMQMLHLEQLLHQTLDELAERGIEAMLLKGSGLAYTVYSSFAERPMGDVDLLVRRPDAERAWLELQRLGWKSPATRWAAARYTTHQHLPPLVQEPWEFRLEIHGDLLPGGHPFGISAEALWARAQRVNRNGRVFTIPHRLDQLWHVCVHFAWQHGMQWGSWLALRDAAVIVQRGDFAWPEFLDFARETQAGTCCYWTLRLARRLAAATVPDRVLAALRPPGFESMLEELERHYVLSFFPRTLGCPSAWLSHRLWEAGVRPRWSGHGRARPWHVSERYMMGAEQPKAAKSRRRPWWARLWKLSTWLAYIRRIRRFNLPLDLPLTTPGEQP